MAPEPWYKLVTLRREVWEGRSCSPEKRLLDAMLLAAPR